MTNQNAIVGAGEEFTALQDFFHVDLSETSIKLSILGTFSTNVGDDTFWTFTLDPDLVFASINEISDTFTNGADLVSFAGNTATFHIANQSITADQEYAAFFSIAVRDISNNVPEPGSLALLGLGLAGLAAIRKRKQA